MRGKKSLQYNGKLDRGFYYPRDLWDSLRDGLYKEWSVFKTDPFIVLFDGVGALYERVYNRINRFFGGRDRGRDKVGRDRFNPTASSDNTIYSQLRGIFQPFRKMKRGVVESFSPYKSWPHLVRDLLQGFRGVGNIVHAILSTLASISLIFVPALFGTGIIIWGFIFIQVAFAGSMLASTLAFLAYLVGFIGCVSGLLAPKSTFTKTFLKSVYTPIVAPIAMLLFTVPASLTHIANNLATAIRGVLQIAFWLPAVLRLVFIRGPRTLSRGYQPAHENKGIRHIATLLKEKTTPWFGDKKTKWRDASLLKSALLFEEILQFIIANKIKMAGEQEFRDFLTSKNIKIDESSDENIKKNEKDETGMDFWFSKNSSYVPFQDTQLYKEYDVNENDNNNDVSIIKCERRIFIAEQVGKIWQRYFTWLKNDDDQKFPIVSLYYMQENSRNSFGAPDMKCITSLSEELTKRLERIKDSSQGNSVNSKTFLEEATRKNRYQGDVVHQHLKKLAMDTEQRKMFNQEYEKSDWYFLNEKQKLRGEKIDPATEKKNARIQKMTLAEYQKSRDISDIGVLAERRELLCLVYEAGFLADDVLEAPKLSR